MNLKQGQIITYADDTVLLFSAKTWKDVNDLANKGFNLVVNWLNSNLLTLNVLKTKYVSFSIKNNSQPPSNSIEIKAHTCSPSGICSCPSLTNTASIKYLGLTLDQNLNWKEHIINLTSRIRKQIYIFRNIRHFCPPKIILAVYTALCQSILTYGITAWGGASKTTMITVERAQRAVLKVMSFKKFRHPTQSLYSELSVLSVRKLFMKNILLIQHKKRPDHTTRRRKDLVYNIPSYQTKFAQKFINFLGPYTYNRISKFTKLCDLTKHSCNIEIDKLLKKFNYEDVENILQIIS